MCQKYYKCQVSQGRQKVFINAKCGKNAKSVKSEFKVGRWSLSVILMLQNFQRLVSLLASQIQRHLLFHRSCSFSPSYFSSMRNCLSDASRLKLKRLRLVLTTKRAACVSQTTTSKTDIFWPLNKPAVVRRKGKKSIDRKRTSGQF